MFAHGIRNSFKVCVAFPVVQTVPSSRFNYVSISIIFHPFSFYPILLTMFCVCYLDTLAENNLVGSIPPEIGYFSNLIDLNMANNSIGGSLASVVDLTRLEELNFTLNALTGTLPEFLFTHRTLTDIDLETQSLVWFN